MKKIEGKVVVLGHQGVGKTSTISRYIDKHFNSNISSTIGASFFSCNVQIENVTVKLQIWDTAGQERFKSMVPMFYRNANAAILVYDITKEDTFESMKIWVHELKKNVEQYMVLCVVGNKIDLRENRKVTRDEAQKYSNKIGATYFECSAKEDQGVDQVFTSLGLGLVKMADEEAHHTLKISQDSTCASALVAESSNLLPTDIGKTEEANVSINILAHGNKVPTPKCC